MTPDEVHHLADQFLGAIEAADMDSVRRIYAPDASIWHNYDQIEQTRDENVRVASWFSTRLGDLRYTERRREIVTGGFVQQHVLRGIAPDGTPIMVCAMLRAWCEKRDGQSVITRIEEYLDPAQAAALSR